MRKKNNKKKSTVKNESMYDGLTGFSLSVSFLVIGLALILTSIYKYSYVVGVIFIVISVTGFLIEYQKVLKKINLDEEYKSDLLVSVIIAFLFIVTWYRSDLFPSWLVRPIKQLIIISSLLPLFGFLKGMGGALIMIVKKGRKTEGADLLIQIFAIIIAFVSLILTL